MWQHQQQPNGDISYAPICHAPANIEQAVLILGQSGQLRVQMSEHNVPTAVFQSPVATSADVSMPQQPMASTMAPTAEAQAMPQAMPQPMAQPVPMAPAAPWHSNPGLVEPQATVARPTMQPPTPMDTEPPNLGQVATGPSSVGSVYVGIPMPAFGVPVPPPPVRPQVPHAQIIVILAHIVHGIALCMHSM